MNYYFLLLNIRCGYQLANRKMCFEMSVMWNASHPIPSHLSFKQRNPMHGRYPWFALDIIIWRTLASCRIFNSTRHWSNYLTPCNLIGFLSYPILVRYCYWNVSWCQIVFKGTNATLWECWLNTWNISTDWLLRHGSQCDIRYETM